MAPCQVGAAGPTAVRDLIRGKVRPAVVLGAFPTAMYLRLAGDEVIALLARDAVRLPLGLRLPTLSTESPLDELTGPVSVGDSLVQVGDLSVGISRLVSVTVPCHLTPDSRSIAYASRRLHRLCLAERALPLIDALGALGALETGTQAQDVAAVVDSFVGVGPGLTPAGDDVLAGFLVAAWSFGLAQLALRVAVTEAVPGATTALSAALLRCACRGESIPQVSALLSALSRPAEIGRHLDQALVGLTQVGHSSGAALAHGILAAAKVAGRPEVAVDTERQCNDPGRGVHGA